MYIKGVVFVNIVYKLYFKLNIKIEYDYLTW